MTSLLCLALNIYFEARGETVDAQLLVAESAINRSADRNQSICEVVYDEYQYSWTNDHLSDTPRDMQSFAVATSIAQAAINGDHLYSGVTHYHEASIHPHWADSLVLLGRYGNHIFYRS